MHESTDEPLALRALAALAQAQRLRAFRTLVAAGSAGLTPGLLAPRLGLAPSALSFHLKELAGAGLITCEPRGRHLVYRADYRRMHQLLAYLTQHCCQAPAREPAEAGSCRSC